MQVKNTETSYGLTTQIFHWGIGLLMIALLGVGFVMTDMADSPFKFQIYGLHKAFGITVLALGALRLFWRLYNPPPQPLPHHKPWEKKLSRFIHLFFYAAIIAMPLVGWAMSSSAGYPVSWFGLFTLPELVAENKTMAGFYKEVHEYLGYVIAACIALHVAGALKHHIQDRDTTLLRMAPFLKKKV